MLGNKQYLRKIDYKKEEVYMNMKIGIMTWHEYYNYGTSLQLYAISSILREMGHDPVVINYHTREPGHNGVSNHLVPKMFRKIENHTDETFTINQSTSQNIFSFLPLRHSFFMQINNLFPIFKVT